MSRVVRLGVLREGLGGAVRAGGGPQARPAKKWLVAQWGWEGRVRRPAPAPHAAQASRGVLGVLCSQGE